MRFAFFSAVVIFGIGTLICGMSIPFSLAVVFAFRRDALLTVILSDQLLRPEASLLLSGVLSQE